MSRLDKVNHQLKREISVVIQRELGDPRLGFVTIVEVKTSPDLRSAKVFYSVLGNAKQIQGAKYALESARGMIRRLNFIGMSIGPQ
jgi:ribosome-binding factor A